MATTRSTGSPQSVREAFDLWTDGSISKDSHATTQTESTIHSSFSSSSRHENSKDSGDSKQHRLMNHATRSVKRVLFSPSDDVVEIEHVDDIPEDQHEAVWWTKDEFKKLKKEYTSVVKKVEAGKKVKNDSFRGLESRILEQGQVMYAVICRAKDAVFEEQDLQVMSGISLPNEIRASYIMAARSARIAALANAKKDHEAVREYLQDVEIYWEDKKHDGLSDAESMHSCLSPSAHSRSRSSRGSQHRGRKGKKHSKESKSVSDIPQSLNSENIELLQQSLEPDPNAKVAKDASVHSNHSTTSSSRRRSSSVGKRSMHRKSGAAWMGVIGDDGEMIAETATTIAIRSPKKAANRRGSLDSSMKGMSQNSNEQDPMIKSPMKGSSRRQSMDSCLTGMRTEDAVVTPVCRKGINRRRSLESCSLKLDDDVIPMDQTPSTPVARSARKAVNRRRSLDSSIASGENLEAYTTPIRRSPRKGVSRRGSLDSSMTNRRTEDSPSSVTGKGEPRVIIRSPRRKASTGAMSVMSQGTYSAPRSFKVQQGLSEKGLQFAEIVRKASRSNSADFCNNSIITNDAICPIEQKKKPRRHSLEVTSAPKESNDMLSYVEGNCSPVNNVVQEGEEESIVRRCTRRSSVDLYREHSLRGARALDAQDSDDDTKPKSGRRSINEPPSMFSQEFQLEEKDLEWPSWPEHGGASFDTDSLEGSADDVPLEDYEYEPPHHQSPRKQPPRTVSNSSSGDDEEKKRLSGQTAPVSVKKIQESCKATASKTIDGNEGHHTHDDTICPRSPSKKPIRFVKGLMRRFSRGGRCQLDD